MGRQMGDRGYGGGEHSWSKKVCVCVGMYGAGVCLPVAIGAYICVSAIRVTVCVLTCMCVCEGQGQA